MFGCALLAFGGLMAVAATAERLGYTERWCREFSASLLGASWIAVWFHALHSPPDTLVLTAPIYILACGYSWWVEASAARCRAITARGLNA
jgi:hypothetical protein